MVNSETQAPRGLRLPGVLMLLVGIALGSSVAIPMWFGRPAITLNNAAELLDADLEELRQRASYLFADVQITFDDEGDGYRMSDSFGTPLSAPIGGGEYKRCYSVDAVFRGVRILSVDIEGRDGRTLGISPQGDFKHSATIEIGFEGERRSIFIDSESGEVEIGKGAEDQVVQAPPQD